MWGLWTITLVCGAVGTTVAGGVLWWTWKPAPDPEANPKNTTKPVKITDPPTQDKEPPSKPPREELSFTDASKDGVPQPPQRLDPMFMPNRIVTYRRRQMPKVTGPLPATMDPVALNGVRTSRFESE